MWTGLSFQGRGSLGPIHSILDLPLVADDLVPERGGGGTVTEAFNGSGVRSDIGNVIGLRVEESCAARLLSSASVMAFCKPLRRISRLLVLVAACMFWEC